MTKSELRKYALDRHHARATRLVDATDGLPRRKSGELSLLVKMAEQAHKLLSDYDAEETPPSAASITETFFDTALARIDEIKAAAQTSSVTSAESATDET